MRDEDVTIRHCHAIEEFERMVELEARVWGFGERDVVPSQMYVVAAKIGGQVLGAFVEGEMVGFLFAYPGICAGGPYLHSHMAAVLPEFRDSGIGRELKLAQREDALARGIKLIEWTFDPLQTRNAYFNVCRLGTTARRYLPNAYGFTTSPLHGGLPTDRLVAEWHLDSDRTAAILEDKLPECGPGVERVRVDLADESPEVIAETQAKVRERFEALFAAGYAVTWFERDPGGGSYVLEKR